MLIPETTNSNLPGFAKHHPEELWLEVDAETQHKAEELANTQVYPALRSRVYLNQVARSSLLKGLNEQIKEQIDEEVEVSIISKDTNQEEWLRNWVFINGSDLECKITSEAKTSTRRLVLIPLNPSEDSHLFCVPREWVDIEDWAADYYLSVHISPEENWLRLRGFKTHKQLKQEAEYNPYNFSYEMSPDNLITDFSLLLLSFELATDTKPQWEAQEELLPQAISQEEANAILSKWGKPSPYSPRILMDFNKWVALIQNPDWKEKLYQKRIQYNKQIRNLAEAYFGELPIELPIEEMIESYWVKPIVKVFQENEDENTLFKNLQSIIKDFQNKYQVLMSTTAIQATRSSKKKEDQSAEIAKELIEQYKQSE